MPNIDIFYGITTTTLVVLSSATLVVFKYLTDSVNSIANSCENSIKELDGKEKTCGKEILIILGENSKILSRRRGSISTNAEWEYVVLFLVILLSAISIFLTLLSGVLGLNLNIKWVLSINLLSIIIYISAFLRLLYSTSKKKKLLKIIISESKMSIKSVSDAIILSNALNQEKLKKQEQT